MFLAAFTAIAFLAMISDNVLLAIIALLGGAFTGVVAPIIMFILKERSDARIRREEREERAALAKITADKLAEVKVEGGAREKRIIDEVNKVKAVAITGVRSAKEAFKEANGVNGKIAALGQKLIDDKATPQPVEIMNGPEHPVPTHEQ